MNKVAIILRGQPGSGKSYYAAEHFKGATICSADHYMVDLYGDYKFDPKKLNAAHASCYGKFVDSLEKNHEMVVLDNTNIKVAWFQEYLDAAKEYGYVVKIIRILCEPKLAYMRNQHDVPFEKIQSGYQSLINQTLLENEVVVKQ